MTSSHTCVHLLLIDGISVDILPIDWPYYAAILIARNTGLACPSICLSVCPTRAHNLKTKSRRQSTQSWSLFWLEAGRNDVIRDDIRREPATKARTIIRIIRIIIRLIIMMTEWRHHLLPCQRGSDQHWPEVQRRFRHCAVSRRRCAGTKCRHSVGCQSYVISPWADVTDVCQAPADDVIRRITWRHWRDRISK